MHVPPFLWFEMVTHTKDRRARHANILSGKYAPKEEDFTESRQLTGLPGVSGGASFAANIVDHRREARPIFSTHVHQLPSNPAVQNDGGQGVNS